MPRFPHRIAQVLVVPYAKLRAALAAWRQALRAAPWRAGLAAVFDLTLAVLLCLLVAALAGLILVVLAWLYGAPGSALRAWFGAGFALGVLGIALLFLWDRRA